MRFIGSVGYSHLSTIVLLQADQVQNFSTTGSAALRMELWATPAPYTGSFSGGYQIAAYGLGSLAAGATLTSVSSGALTWNEPPSGTWYVAMVLTEQAGMADNAGYTPRSWLNFPGTITGTGSPPPPDTTPPTVGLTAPAGGNVSGTVTVSANASDNVGVTRVEFYVNGALAGTSSAAPYQYAWNSTTLPNGSATLQVKAYDAAGNVGSSTLVTVNVANAVADTTPPTVAIAAPTGGNVAGTITISANASDNVGVTRVEFYVNGARAATSYAAPYQYAWNTASLPNGSATLQAKAYDTAGNVGTSSVVSVTVANTVADTTAPTVGLTSPTGGNVSGTVSVSANASDNVGVARVEFYVNGALAGTSYAPPYQYAWNTAALPNGSATLRAKAYDTAGNVGASSIVSVTIANVVALPPDTTPPAITLLSPGPGSVSGVITVTAAATDNVGVARVDLLVNGVVFASDARAPWTFAWDSRSLPDGPARLQLSAVDATGNTATSQAVTVNVANGVQIAPLPPIAIEYYNADLDHYFMTAMTDEITLLDAGRFVGWTRTGLSFPVYAAGSDSGNPVCRFYMPPQHGNSHFYSGSSEECAAVAARFPGFVEESTEVFRIGLPSSDGDCAVGTMPVYRVWNQRADSNHRYMTDRNLRDLMVARGYVAEGYGADAVIMCSPL